MDEQEYLDYINAIDRVELEDRQKTLIAECRDEDGYVVPGCTYMLPAQTEA